MKISEIKKKIVIDSYFKEECDVNTSIKEAFVKGFELGLKKAPTTPQSKTGHWTRELIRNEKGGCIGAKMICSECGNDNKHDEYMPYCPNCGVRMTDLPESRE